MCAKSGRPVYLVTTHRLPIKTSTPIARAPVCTVGRNSGVYSLHGKEIDRAHIPGKRIGKFVMLETSTFLLHWLNSS